MTTKTTPAQQHILDLMQKGHVLSSQLETKYRPFDMPSEFGGYLRHPHTDRCSKTVLVSTIKAMLARGLIVESNRYIGSSGTDDGHETETWCIHYKINTEPSETHPHWPAGAKVMRRGGTLDIGTTLDETWQNWNGVGFFNHVRWEGSGYTSTVRADRLKEALNEARKGVQS